VYILVTGISWLKMALMQYRELGAHQTRVSVVGLGTWEFGQTEAWGSRKVSEYACVIDSAIEAGVNFIDTAEGYGKSEEILGELLKGKRDKVILATKIGYHHWDYDTMQSSLQRSLKRLQTDYVDVYQIHWPRIKGIRDGGDHGRSPSNMGDEDYEQIASSLERLESEGLIRIGGVSNFRLDHLNKFRHEAFRVIASDQVPYCLLWRAYDDPNMISFCRMNGLGYLTYSSLAVGLLTGKYNKETALAPAQRANILFNEPVLSRALKVVDAVREIAKEVDASPSQVALKWVLDRDLTTSALVGTRNVKNLEENVEAVNLHLTREQSERLDEASQEFWTLMHPELEMWTWDNSKANLDRIGLEPQLGA
jgi:aryl-alcohol dehydrogenase-like predicted oxidoreductase